MKDAYKKPTVAFLLSMLVISMMMLCSCSSDNASADNLTGTVTIAGSTALQPIVEQAADMFMDIHMNVAITVQGGGSGTGLTQVADGAVDIGTSDVPAEDKLPMDKAKTLVDHQVVAQGFAVIANKGVGVDNLTKQQLQDIFLGKVTNWKDLGGADEAIVVVNRPSSSGTRATFVKVALNGQQPVEGNTLTQDSNGAVLKIAAETPGAISYVGLAYLNDSVKALKLDGVEPTVENIVAGTYPLWSWGHMYTKGEPTGAVKAFLDYMASDDVARMARQRSYIAGSDAMKLNK